MAKMSQSKRIAEFLRTNPYERYTARQIAEAIVNLNPEDYREKRKNPRFSSEHEFISQVVAEIGVQKNAIAGQDSHIFWQDRPRPRVFWYDPEQTRDDVANSNVDDESEIEVEVSTSKELSEHDLYPLLIDYLKSELGLYCLRIDEKRSINSRGTGGNQWLHPDIVAMQAIDKDWNELVRSCVKKGTGQSIRLWSFEVKKQLNGSNVRKSYFQAVSNSSWANEGYLVATSISDSHVEQELRMLSSLHGIGLILLNPENPSESDIVLPAQSRAEVDWQSVNRIVIENQDFKEYVDLVSTYLQTGRIRGKDWNRA